MNLAVSANNVEETMIDMLKRICLEYKINNPVIGEELYNPNEYDGTKVP